MDDVPSKLVEVRVIRIWGNVRKPMLDYQSTNEPNDRIFAIDTFSIFRTKSLRDQTDLSKKFKTSSPIMTCGR